MRGTAVQPKREVIVRITHASVVNPFVVILGALMVRPVRVAYLIKPVHLALVKGEDHGERVDGGVAPALIVEAPQLVEVVK